MRQVPPRIRELFGRDIKDGGFLKLLGQLSRVGLTAEQGAEQLNYRIKYHVRTWVALNARDRVVGTISLAIEPKYIHRGGKLAHVEDLVVDRNYRRQGIGRRLLAEAAKAAKQAGCYRLVLDCSAENVAFYERCGYRPAGVAMRKPLRKR